MVKRKERRREIERLFVLRAREGLSLRELAARSGIPLGTLIWWSQRLREEARASESRTESMPAFSQVRLVGPVAAPVEFAGEVGSAVRVRYREARWSSSRASTRSGWSARCWRRWRDGLESAGGGQDLPRERRDRHAQVVRWRV